MASWARVATRARVPLGFVFAGVFLWLATPSWPALTVGTAVIAGGLLLRALASGHIHKNRQVTVTGPYAYTRNPLYLGSILIAAGFVVAARNWWIAAAAAAMFFFIYLPVIRAEEKYLRTAFPEYAGYAAHVPRLWPRLMRYRTDSSEAGGFSRELYLRHREYNAAIGSLLMLGALILKMVLVQH